MINTLRHIDLKDAPFRLEELVPKEIFRLFGDQSISFIDPIAFRVLLHFRKTFGSTYVNTWVFGGDRQFAGYRPPDCEIGAKYSQHKRGAAFDPVAKNYTAAETYEEILINSAEWMDLGLTTVENIEHTPTWNHLDTRITNLTELLKVNP